MITFLLCGLWHGASWTFIIWGGYFGILIILERPFREHIQRAPAYLVIPVTNLLVIIGWVFFKARSVEESIIWLRAMFGFGSSWQSNFLLLPNSHLIFLICFQIGCWSGLFKTTKIKQGSRWSDPLLILVFLASFVSIMGVEVSPFLYYQF